MSDVISIIIRIYNPCRLYLHLCLSVVGASLDWFGFLLFYWYMEKPAWSVWVFTLAWLKTLFTVMHCLHRRPLLHRDVLSASTTFMVLSCFGLILGFASTVTYLYWAVVFSTQHQALCAVWALGTAITWAIPCSYFSWRYRQVALGIRKITRPLLAVSSVTTYV